MGGSTSLVRVNRRQAHSNPERAARYGGRFVEKPFDPIEFGALVRRPAEATRARSSRLADDAKALRRRRNTRSIAPPDPKRSCFVPSGSTRTGDPAD